MCVENGRMSSAFNPGLRCRLGLRQPCDTGHWPDQVEPDGRRHNVTSNTISHQVTGREGLQSKAQSDHSKDTGQVTNGVSRRGFGVAVQKLHIPQQGRRRSLVRLEMLDVPLVTQA